VGRGGSLQADEVSLAALAHTLSVFVFSRVLDANCSLSLVLCPLSSRCPTAHTALGDVHVYEGRPQWNQRFVEIGAQHPTENIGVTFCGQSFLFQEMVVVFAEHKFAHYFDPLLSFLSSPSSFQAIR
jgi:hypothetical protein